MFHIPVDLLVNPTQYFDLCYQDVSKKIFVAVGIVRESYLAKDQWMQFVFLVEVTVFLFTNICFMNKAI